MEPITVALPDGSRKEVPAGTTPLEIAESISPGLAQAALVAETSGRLVDLTHPLDECATLRLLTSRDPEALEVYRHSSAHLLAAAVLELYPETKLGIGPPTEQGFFYDFQRDEPFTPDDLAKIEARMGEIAKRDPKNERVWLPRQETVDRFKKLGEEMKVELIEDKAAGDKISIYRTDGFEDFCRGPHIPSMGRIKAFKLLSVAGAYWKGDERNARLQRIYGTSFFSKKELNQHLHRLEEAKKRDHRKLGKELDLFSIQETAGPGLIFWHPKGGVIRTIMEDWLREQYVKRGYGLVYTPHVARYDLWKTSGHADFFSDDMFSPMELNDAEYQLRPMNCPFHTLIYKDRLRSYRDLPIRLGELGTVYRYERSGVMHGLMRVRGFTQDDAHIFCTPEQVKDEIVGCVDFGLDILKTFGFDQYAVELSTWDGGGGSDKYAGSPEEWQMAEDGLFQALKERQIEAKVMPDEAAFYGPKIDIKLVDAIGRPWQLSTVQFDFNLPRRFELEYIAEDGKAHQPVMVHRALWGSVERFFGVLVEHYAGAFPVWLAPMQAAVLPITDKQNDYANEVLKRLDDAGIRAQGDLRSVKVNAKIREAQLQKIPYMLVIGGREAEAGTVAVRHRTQGDQGAKPLDEFIHEVRVRIDSKDCTP